MGGLLFFGSLHEYAKRVYFKFIPYTYRVAGLVYVNRD